MAHQGRSLVSITRRRRDISNGCEITNLITRALTLSAFFCEHEMKNTLTKFLIVILASLTSSLSSITNADVSDTPGLDALNKFFDALSVDNYESGALENQVTDDFIIFEMGQRFTLAQFKTFLASANYENWKSTQWTISDATVTSVNGMTHISYKNTGVFVFPSQDSSTKLTEQRNIWLESALLVVDGEQLKLKFLQSENIFRKETVLGSQ